MSELLERAFTALGPHPSPRELELVTEAVRGSGDEVAVAALERAGAPGGSLDPLVRLAAASGSNGLVALDFVTEFQHPGSFGDRHRGDLTAGANRRGP